MAETCAERAVDDASLVRIQVGKLVRSEFEIETGVEFLMYVVLIVIPFGLARFGELDVVSPAELGFPLRLLVITLSTAVRPVYCFASVVN
jgi:hypothetical protein